VLNILEFSIKLNDLMSGALGKLDGRKQGAFSKIQDSLKGIQAAGKGVGVAATGRINQLRAGIDRLRQSRDLIHPSNTAQLCAFNSQINSAETNLPRLETMNGSRLKT
jgi:hypothetical protein